MVCERCGSKDNLDYCDTGQKDHFGEPIEICMCEKCLEELEQEYSERQKLRLAHS